MSEMPADLPRHPVGTFAFVGAYLVLHLTRYGSPGFKPF